LFLFIILTLLLMINAVFAWVFANFFISYSASVILVFIKISLSIWIGYAAYKRNMTMFIPILIALAIMSVAAVLAAEVPMLQIDLVQYMGGEDGDGIFGLGAVSSAFFIWIMILLIYVYFASTLPVWKLLQPRDFINSHQLSV